jgi:CHASE1-domain containing sensor protein
MTATPSNGRVPRRDRAARWPGALRGAALAVMLAGVLGSVWVARGWQSTVTHQRDERLDRTAAARTATIGSVLGGYEDALLAARSLWLASDHVSREDFGRFARSLDRETRDPGLQNISWRQVVRDDQAAGFVAAARAEGVEDFTIRPPGRRPIYYVTRYSYPPGSRLGLDARAIPGVYASLDVARDSGETTISNQITLDDDPGPATRREVAYELIVPVYRTDRPLGGAAEHRREFRGWASGQFRAVDLLGEALSSSSATGPTTGVELHDQEVGTASLVASFPPRFRAQGPYVRTEAFSFGGRRFTLVYAPLPGNAILTERTIPAPVVLGTGIAISLLVGRCCGCWSRSGPSTGRWGAWQGKLRKTDLLARYGGEEFAVLLPDCGLDNAMQIAERLRIAQPEVTCSLGVADWDGREDATELVARADRALYAAKAAGRNRSFAAPGATTAPVAPAPMS